MSGAVASDDLQLAIDCLDATGEEERAVDGVEATEKREVTLTLFRNSARRAGRLGKGLESCSNCCWTSFDDPGALSYS